MCRCVLVWTDDHTTYAICSDRGSNLQTVLARLLMSMPFAGSAVFVQSGTDAKTRTPNYACTQVARWQTR